MSQPPPKRNSFTPEISEVQNFFVRARRLFFFNPVEHGNEPKLERAHRGRRWFGVASIFVVGGPTAGWTQPENQGLSVSAVEVGPDRPDRTPFGGCLL
jgi:hypothetical protein